MNPRIRISPRADADLDDHFLFIAQNNVDAGLRFLEAAEEAFEKLAEHPAMGRRYEPLHSHLEAIRCWPIRGFENHLIFYRVTGEGVFALRVLHGARDISQILHE